MTSEMRDISADLRERADLLVKQMIAEQARFRCALTELEKEEAIRRQRLKTALEAVERLIKVLGVQHALHRGLKSAVAALDTLGPARPQQKARMKSARSVKQR
jgi:hypothetical protein